MSIFKNRDRELKELKAENWRLKRELDKLKIDIDINSKLASEYSAKYFNCKAKYEELMNSFKPMKSYEFLVNSVVEQSKESLIDRFWKIAEKVYKKEYIEKMDKDSINLILKKIDGGE